VKALKITLIVGFVVAIFLFSGLVSALDSSAISTTAIFSTPQLSIGSTVTIRITLQSNTAEVLKIQRMGINFDWMPSTGFYGVDLSDNPVTVEGNGTYSSAPFIVQIPTNVSAGSHAYLIGIDGLEEGTTETAFSWNSTTATIEVISGSTSSTTPTPTTTSGGGGQTESPLTLLIYGVVIAIVAVVVITVIVILMRRKPKQTPSADQTPKSDEGQNKKEEKDSFDAQI
jgi:hypothetical protein